MEEQQRHIKIKELKGRIQNNLSGFLRGVVVGLLVMVQFAILIVLPFVLSSYTIYFYIILEIASIVVILNLVNDNRSPSYKIAWICIALALPITGHIMYWLWGTTGSKKKIDKNILSLMQHGEEYIAQDPAVLEEFGMRHPTIFRMTKYMSSCHFPLIKNNLVEYYPMGEDVFEDIFDKLQKAEHFILIDFFIVAEGAIWDKMHEILVQKIKAGIEVKFLYDDFGAMIRTGKHFRRELEEEGFEISVFNPIHKYTDKLYMNYRSHQKILVIDGNIGYTGGFNLADEYANLIERFGVWKDNAIRMEGGAVWGLTVTFLQMWEVSQGRAEIDFERYRPTVTEPKGDVYCQVISDGPANNPNNPIENTYMQMIQYAEKYLYITTPYLIIEEHMQEALIMAVKSGVDVRIITPNIADKKRVKLITNFNYGMLLRSGIKIYEYTPGFIHAKTILNDTCGIIGTINMDYRSFYLHYENGVWMSGESVLKSIKADMDKTIALSREVTYDEWINRPFIMKVCQMVLNLFATLM